MPCSAIVKIHTRWPCLNRDHRANPVTFHNLLSDLPYKVTTPGLCIKEAWHCCLPRPQLIPAKQVNTAGFLISSFSPMMILRVYGYDTSLWSTVVSRWCCSAFIYIFFFVIFTQAYCHRVWTSLWASSLCRFFFQGTFSCRLLKSKLRSHYKKMIIHVIV